MAAPYPLPCPDLGPQRLATMQASVAGWLTSPAFADVAEAFGGKPPVSTSNLEVCQWLLDFSERWDFRHQQATVQAVDTRERARWLLDDSTLTDAQRDAAMRAAKDLGLLGITKPLGSNYDYILVLGGARLSCLLRTRMAAKVLAELGGHAATVALLSGGRLVADSERAATDTYAPAAHTEFDLMNASVEQYFALEPGHTETRHDDALGLDASWAIREYRLQHWAAPVISYMSPSSDPEHRRANSADTYQFFFDRNKVRPGSKMLLITSQIYVPYQQIEAMRTVALTHEVFVETIGFPNEWSGSQHGLMLASNYLQEMRSAIQAASRLLNQPMQ